MKKIVLILFMSLVLFARDNVIVVGATPVPHAAILEAARPVLKEMGYELRIKIYRDYIGPNLALEKGRLDANYFQHALYLKEFNKEHHTHLISLCRVHLEPMALYSKYGNMEILERGSRIAIPDDPTNRDRALRILEQNHMIKIYDKVYLATPDDIVENKYNFEIKEVDASLLTRAIRSYDGVFINVNYALEVGLNPLYDSVILESEASNYVNIVAIRKGDIDSPKILALKKALRSKPVIKYINKEYRGAVIPAF